MSPDHKRIWTAVFVGGVIGGLIAPNWAAVMLSAVALLLIHTSNKEQP